MNENQIPSLQASSFRARVLPLLKLATPSLFPLDIIECLLEALLHIQCLKFPLDYFTETWISTLQPIYSYLDFSYYLNAGSYQFALIATIVYMNIYWMANLILYVLGAKIPLLAANIRKLAFILSSTILLFPITNIILNQFNCQQATLTLRLCLGSPSFAVQAIATVSFILYSILLIAQAFFNFQFIPHAKHFIRLKSSSFGSTLLILYVYLNQIASYFMSQTIAIIVLDVSIVLVGIIVWLKEEDLIQRLQVTKYSLLGFNLIAIVLLNSAYFIYIGFSLLSVHVLAAILMGSIYQMRLHTLRFELENINKWQTSQIIIKYTAKLRYFLESKEDYERVCLYGYAQIHRQKCDNLACPYRQELPVSEKGCMKEEEQTWRAVRIIKKVYEEGFSINPVSPELQLEHATFLYLQGEKKKALRQLLLIHSEELSMEQFYKYDLMKGRIHQQMSEEPNKTFLDLVSELEVKRQEDNIMESFEKAALISLDFWNTLSEDHPDFEKLDELATSQMRIKEKLRETYSLICIYAHSEKITSVYANYLEAIENDEATYKVIYDQIEDSYDFKDKIRIHNWTNTSTPNLAISVEEADYGTIVNTNYCCSLLFGYERYEILNRNISILFPSFLNELHQFTNVADQDLVCFFQHKSGYLIRMRRNVQSYNSMETGEALICNFENQLGLLECFILIDTTPVQPEIVGSSSSCISLIGQDLQIFDSKPKYEELFVPSLSVLRQLSAAKDTTYAFSMLFKQAAVDSFIEESKFVLQITDYKPYVCLSLRKEKERASMAGRTVSPVSFEFHVQASTSELTYYGTWENRGTYLSQFSKLNFAETEKELMVSQGYGENIITLRMVNNIIQVIENSDLEEIGQQIGLKIEDLNQDQELTRKDEEEIFQNKASFERFLKKHELAKGIIYVLLFGVSIFIGFSVLYYITLTSHNSAGSSFTSELIYANLIEGCLQKESSLLKSLQLMAVNNSQEQVSRFHSVYQDNIAFLQTIQFKGIAPQSVSVTMSEQGQPIILQSFYFDQFLLSFINNALSIYANMSPQTSIPDLVAAFTTADEKKIDFLAVNSLAVGSQYQQIISTRQIQMSLTLNSYLQIEIGMLVGALALGICLALVVGWVIHRISKERVNALSVFLGIKELQIQGFSSRTENFLMSLHVEDTNAGELDVDEELQNTKKLSNATFAKKKSFKLVSHSKAINARLAIIPLIAMAYFVHSYIFSQANLSFINLALPYISDTSRADTIFYGGLSQIQNSMLTQTATPTNLSISYMDYYRVYFSTHYITFGTISSFQDYFSSLFMLDVCNGDVVIPQACLLPLLSSNGTLLIFTDTAMKTKYKTKDSSLQFTYLVGYEVLSQAHRLMSMKVIAQQGSLMNDLSSNLLTILIVWLVALIASTLLYGVPMLRKYVQEINESKNVLGILPVSVAKKMPEVKKLINHMLGREK